jgi:hypothetical protein
MQRFKFAEAIWATRITDLMAVLSRIHHSGGVENMRWPLVAVGGHQETSIPTGRQDKILFCGNLRWLALASSTIFHWTTLELIADKTFISELFYFISDQGLGLKAVFFRSPARKFRFSSRYPLICLSRTSQPGIWLAPIYG